jgi:type IV secretory pathway VirB4 component
MKSSLLLRTRDLLRTEKKMPFFKLIDLYSIEDGLVLGVSGAMGIGYAFQGRDLLLQSEAEIESFEIRMRRFLNRLPEGSQLHFVVKSNTKVNYGHAERISNPPIEDSLAEKITEERKRFNKKHPFIRRDVFLFIVMHPQGRKNRSPYLPDLSAAFGKKAKRLTRLEFIACKEALERTASEIADGFRSLGFTLDLLTDKEHLRYLYEILNPDYSERVLPFDSELASTAAGIPGRSSLRSRILLAPPAVEDRFFYLNRYFHKAVNLVELPEETTLKSLKEFETVLGDDYLMTISIGVPDQDKEKGRIKRQWNYTKAKSFFSRSKDHEAIARAGETDELLSAMAESSDRFFNFSMAVLLRSKNESDLEKKVSEAVRAFTRMGDAHGIDDQMNHDRLFISFMPLQGDMNPLSFLVRSEVLTHFIPVQANWQGTGNAGILLKTYRDEPLRLDLFDSNLQAKHSLMLGTTGSGKSFFTNQLLLSFLNDAADQNVIVIDLGGSYRRLATLLGGSYMEVECSEAFAFNVFPRNGVLFPQGNESDATFLHFLKELLRKMIAPTRCWSPSEKMILERAIQQAYAPLQQNESPILGDIEKALKQFTQGDEDDRRKAYQFAKELCLFTEGEYGKLLNRRGTFDIDARFVVFDLRKISHYPELQEILLMIIPFTLKRKFENLGIKKLLVLDECWHLLKESQGTELVEVFYRTARKMNAGVLSISQNPEDFLDAKVAGVMINNSPVKYILRLKKGHERLSAFGFNENEIQAVRELEGRPGFYSEVFIKFDQAAVVAKVEPSPLEYWIATTDPQDSVEEGKLAKIHSGIDQLDLLEQLSARFPNGVRFAAGGVQ